VTELGLASDATVNTEHHGGPTQAVQVFGDYAWSSRRLGRELRDGTFGDNLTVSGARRVHDRFRNKLDAAGG
jgi:MOSC domain-containing protein YiiM